MNVILSALGDILGSKMLMIACKGINFTHWSLSNYPLGVNLDWGSLLLVLCDPANVSIDPIPSKYKATVANPSTNTDTFNF